MPASRSYIKVNQTGNWNGLLRAFRDMGFDINTAARNGQQEAAKKLIKIVKGHIINQDLPWPKLNEHTKNAKNSSDILIDTRLYFESINYWWENKTIKAGVKRGLHYPSGVEISNVAAMLEFGTSKMPDRPVWGPSLEEIGGKEGLRDIVAESIVRKLQRTFAGTPAQITKDWVMSYY